MSSFSNYSFHDYYVEVDSTITSTGQATCCAHICGTITMESDPGSYYDPPWTELSDIEVTSVEGMSIHWTDERGDHELELHDLDQALLLELADAWELAEYMETDDVDTDCDDDDYYEPSEYDEWMDYDPDC